MSTGNDMGHANRCTHVSARQAHIVLKQRLNLQGTENEIISCVF